MTREIHLVDEKDKISTSLGRAMTTIWNDSLLLFEAVQGSDRSRLMIVTAIWLPQSLRIEPGAGNSACLVVTGTAEKPHYPEPSPLIPEGTKPLPEGETSFALRDKHQYRFSIRRLATTDNSITLLVTCGEGSCLVFGPRAANQTWIGVQPTKDASIRRRAAWMIVAALGLLLVGALLGCLVSLGLVYETMTPHAVNAADLSSGQTKIIGDLGEPLGTLMTIEGTAVNQKGIVVFVDVVNGKHLGIAKRVDIRKFGHPLGHVVLRGYETGNWGDPPDDMPHNQTTQPALYSGFEYWFVVTKVISQTDSHGRSSGSLNDGGWQGYEWEK